jgi:hypothetical protein
MRYLLCDHRQVEDALPAQPRARHHHQPGVPVVLAVSGDPANSAFELIE